MILTKESIYNLLSQDTFLNSIISDRLYPTKISGDSVFPYITFSCHDSYNSGEFAKHTFSIDIFTKSERDLNEISDHVKNLINKPFGNIKMTYVNKIKEEYHIEENTFKSKIDLTIIT